MHAHAMTPTTVTAAVSADSALAITTIERHYANHKQTRPVTWQ